MANKKPKNNITRGYRSTNNKVIEGWTGGEGGTHPEYSSKHKTILFGYFATNKNGKVPEGWRGGQGPVTPTPYTGPKSSFTRAYYSPNIQAYELGWRGGYGFQKHLDYFKNAIALATILVNNQSNIGKIRQASSTTTNLAKTSRGYIQIKFAIALQTSAIVSRYVREKLKTAIANYINIATNSKRFARIRNAIATTTGYAKFTGISRHFRTSVANFVNIAFDGRIDAFFRYANATYIQSVTTFKNSRFTRTAKALQTSLIASVKPLDKYYRKAVATVTSLVNSSKTLNRVKNGSVISANLAKTYNTINRTKQALANTIFLAKFGKGFQKSSSVVAIGLSITIKGISKTSKVILTSLVLQGRLGKLFKNATANQSVLATVTKRSTRIRTSSATVTYEIGNTKFYTYFRIAIANSVLLIESTKARVALINSTFINIASYEQISRFKRSAQAMVTNLSFDGKINDLYKNGIAAITYFITTTQQSRFIRIAETIQTNLAIVSRFATKNRAATANNTFLIANSRIYGAKVYATFVNIATNNKVGNFVRVSSATAVNLANTIKNYGKNIGVVFANLITTAKSSQIVRQGTAIFINAIDSNKISKFTRAANAIVTNIAFDGKIDQFYRYVIATATNIIIATKQSRFIRVAEVIQTNLAIVSKFATKNRVSTVNIVSLITSSRTYGARVSALAVNITNNSKIGKFLRVASTTVINLTIASKLGRFFKTASAITTNIALDGKINQLYRYAIASATNLITIAKQARFIRVAKASQVGIAIATRLVVAKRLAVANRVMLSNVNKNYGKNIKVVFANLVRTTKVARFTRQGTAIFVNVITSDKRSRFIRVARATATNIAFDGKIDQFYRYVIALATGVINTTKSSRFNRNASANRTNLANAKKDRATSIKTLFTGLTTNTKSHAYRKIAKNIVIFLGKVITGGTANYKTASVMQSVSATVTKASNRKKYATATISYQIGTSKSRTYAKRAIATAIGLVRYGLSMVMNVRSIESAEANPINGVNFYVTPNNVDVVGEYTSENDQPGDYSEPVNNLGEDVVPT